MTLSDLDWLCEQIEEHSNYPDLCAKGGFDFKLWVFWALEKQFIWLNQSPPTAGLIARPINRSMVFSSHEYPQDQLLYLFDYGGDGMWVDFLWAPNQLSEVLDFCESTGKKWAGWQRRQTGVPRIRSIRGLQWHLAKS